MTLEKKIDDRLIWEGASHKNLTSPFDPILGTTRQRQAQRTGNH